MKKKNQPTQKRYLLKLSENTELCKGLLLFSAGYIFCYMFLLDYNMEGMNIFFRWSTTSYSQFQHPFLFAIWCFLCAFTFLLNLDRMRRRYDARQKILVVLQYIGFVFLFVTLFVPTHHAPHETFMHYVHYYVHLYSAIIYAVSNAFCLFFMFIFKIKEDKRFKKWVFGGAVFIVTVSSGFALHLCGFIETVPTLIAMAAMYILNYTNAIPSAEKQAASVEKEPILN